MRELALFAGAGGGILGGHLLGWRTVCAVEYDPYAIAVLCARQNDGVLAPFPIWDDIRTFDGTPWRGRVDVISGGFPCTDISSAGKGAGIDGAASGLWSEMARVIGEVRPQFAFVENSPLLVSRGLARVLGDLAQMGYDARWCVLGADDAGAPHRRKRIWIVAHLRSLGHLQQDDEVRTGRDAAVDGGRYVAQSQGVGHGQGGEPGDVREAERGQDGRLHGIACGAGDVAGPESLIRRPGLRQDGPQRDGAVVADGGADVPDAPGERGCSGDSERQDAADARQLRGSAGQDGSGVGWWQFEPSVDLLANGLASGLHGADATITEGVGRVATGVPARVQRLKCIGNGQVPATAAMAWRILTEDWHD